MKAKSLLTIVVVIAVGLMIGVCSQQDGIAQGKPSPGKACKDPISALKDSQQQHRNNAWKNLGKAGEAVTHQDWDTAKKMAEAAASEHDAAARDQREIDKLEHPDTTPPIKVDTDGFGAQITKMFQNINKVGQ